MEDTEYSILVGYSSDTFVKDPEFDALWASKTIKPMSLRLSDVNFTSDMKKIDTGRPDKPNILHLRTGTLKIPIILTIGTRHYEYKVGDGVSLSHDITKGIYKADLFGNPTLGTIAAGGASRGRRRKNTRSFKKSRRQSRRHRHH